ncbi:nucleotidyltransferase family protein [Micromonospora sp. KC207]|uniref:nucleotidyltransferase family protein n=1 Tax=Micromonospora sp. KC207 TaxID=2530377 RepID=UPI00104B1B05|nr:nucleotidyltransferase family protein [Micromonospora sp. KC207]TDC59822.1 nucleotidyltransferase family protein [Micromonospora sp. KC207]
MTVAGLLLAAGAGRRYGRPKALVRYEGRLLVERAGNTLRGAGCAPVLVVLGAGADQVRASADMAHVEVVDNPHWETGMASSLRAGLAALAGGPAVAAVVLLVDMPGVTAAAVRRVASGATPDSLAAAGYGDGRRGHPVLLGRERWGDVAATARGDAGARDYLRAHLADLRIVPCGDVADDADLDVPGVVDA